MDTKKVIEILENGERTKVNDDKNEDSMILKLSDKLARWMAQALKKDEEPDLSLNEYACDKCNRSFYVRYDNEAELCPICGEKDVHMEYHHESKIVDTAQSENLGFSDDLGTTDDYH